MENIDDFMNRVTVFKSECWRTYVKTLDDLINGHLQHYRAVMARGRTGIGKTYTTLKLLEENKMIPYGEYSDENGYINSNMETNSDEYDYISLSGTMGFREIHRNLYKHRSKLIIFDNLDNMWWDRDLAQIMKSALDPTGDGTVQFATQLNDKDLGKIPASFKFAGKILFITNMTKNDLIKKKVDSVVEQCCISFDLDVGMDDKASFIKWEDAVAEKEFFGRRIDY